MTDRDQSASAGARLHALRSADRRSSLRFAPPWVVSAPEPHAAQGLCPVARKMYGARHCAPRPWAFVTHPWPHDATHAMSSVSVPERRRHPRIAVSWPVRLWVDDEALLGRVEDASRHGLWVTVPPTTSLKLGKVCWIDVLSEEFGLFTVAGEVRHIAGRRVGLETTRPVPIGGHDSQ